MTSVSQRSMKMLLVLLVLFGLCGLVGFGLPVAEDAPSLLSTYFHYSKHQLVVMLVGFGLPTAAAAICLIRPPANGWSGSAMLVGFLLAAAKIRVWTSVDNFGDQPLSWKLMMVAIFGGTIASLIVTTTSARKT